MIRLITSTRQNICDPLTGPEAFLETFESLHHTNNEDDSTTK